MAVARTPRLTLREFIEIENAAEQRHEFVDGRIFAMAGASSRHVRIMTNIQVYVSPRVHRIGCDSGTPDLRLHSEPTGGMFYPDFGAWCGDARRWADRDGTLLEPTLLIEVSSPSSERFDRDVKLRAYRRFASLRDYLIVAQDRLFDEHYSRDGASQT
jgi:Uma2 family endonuclease